MAPSLRSVAKRMPVAFGSLGITGRPPWPGSVLTKIVQPPFPLWGSVCGAGVGCVCGTEAWVGYVVSGGCSG